MKEDRKHIKALCQQAKDRFSICSTFDNILFASELLSLESDELYKKEKKDLVLKLSKISYELSMLLNNIKEIESED